MSRALEGGDFCLQKYYPTLDMAHGNMLDPRGRGWGPASCLSGELIRVKGLAPCGVWGGAPASDFRGKTIENFNFFPKFSIEFFIEISLIFYLEFLFF